jgi:hypothetical protein
MIAGHTQHAACNAVRYETVSPRMAHLIIKGALQNPGNVFPPIRTHNVADSRGQVEYATLRESAFGEHLDVGAFVPVYIAGRLL